MIKRSSTGEGFNDIDIITKVILDNSELLSEFVKEDHVSMLNSKTLKKAPNKLNNKKRSYISITKLPKSSKLFNIRF